MSNQTSRGKLPQPDSPEQILDQLLTDFYTDGNAKRVALAKLDEYYTNKFLEIVGERPEMQEGFEFPCRFCGFDPDKLLKRIKLL